MFLKGLVEGVHILDLIPLIIISFTPTFYFIFELCCTPHLRKQWYKLVIGGFVNRCISPFMSMAVFSLVVKNLGSQVWGMTGGSAATAVVAAPVVAEKTAEGAEGTVVVAEPGPKPTVADVL
jgi:chitin synthase